MKQPKKKEENERIAREQRKEADKRRKKTTDGDNFREKFPRASKVVYNRFSAYNKHSTNEKMKIYNYISTILKKNN